MSARLNGLGLMAHWSLWTFSLEAPSSCYGFCDINRKSFFGCWATGSRS